jgi:hypothetical protein
MANAPARIAMLLFVASWFLGTAQAHEPHEPHAAWYKSQRMNGKTKERLGVSYQSCCDVGDVFPTRFRMVNDGSRYGTETYEYLKDGRWFVVPPDIIQRKKTPDGRPVLFLNHSTGVEYCFIIDEEGI